MKKRYGILIVLFIFLVAGLGVSLINRFYSINYFYDLLIKREFAINPMVKIDPEKEYQISIWYYPFFQTIKKEQDSEKEFFQQAYAGLKKTYPNLNIKIRKLSFLNGEEELTKAITAGSPPDIYLNFTNDSQFDTNYKIPVEPYLTSEEKQGYYTVDWAKINRDNHLWGWPFLVQRQFWLANSNFDNLLNSDYHFLEKVNKLKKDSLVLNYADSTLLLQLLTLTDLDKIPAGNKQLTGEQSQKIKSVFDFLHTIRKNEVFAVTPWLMDNNFLKAFLESDKLIIGPINPWLEKFILTANQENYHKIFLNNLVKVYMLNIFRQKHYKGDDHTKMVMEVARNLSQHNSTQLAAELGLEKPYRQIDLNQQQSQAEVRQLLEITPANQQYWQEKIFPAWLKFWEEGLTPAEVMTDIES